MKKLEQTRAQRIHDIGLELQARDEVELSPEAFAAAVRDGALERGLAPAYLARAEQELARRESAEADATLAMRTRRRRLVTGAVVALAVLAGGWGLNHWLNPPPAPPWSETFTEASRWSLDVNAGSRAALRWEQGPRGSRVAVVRIDALEADPSSAARVNLDGSGVPANLARYTTLRLDLRGSLPTARVYIEAGSEERWRSPAIAVTETWVEHALPLKNFERQTREAGKWHTAKWTAPENVTQLSVKVGDFMNPPGTTGELSVDGFRLE